MGLIDRQRQKLSSSVQPLLEDGETIEGQLTYGVVGSAMGSLAKALLASTPAAALGIVVTSERLFFARWDRHGNPLLAGHKPRSEFRVGGIERGIMGNTIALHGPRGWKLKLVCSGFTRGDVWDLADLLDDAEDLPDEA